QPAAGLRGGRAEGDPLAACRVHQCLSCACHRSSPSLANVSFAVRPLWAESTGLSMTENVDFMRVRPEAWTIAARAVHTPPMAAIAPGGPSAPLGEALHSLRMSGAFYCRSELSEPWGLTLPPMPGYLWFHVVTHGHVLLETGAEPTQLRRGDFALVPH